MNRHSKFNEEMQAGQDQYDDDELDEEVEEMIDYILDTTGCDFSRDKVYELLQKNKFDEEKTIDRVLKMVSNPKRETAPPNATISKPNPPPKETHEPSNAPPLHPKSVRKSSYQSGSGTHEKPGQKQHEEPKKPQFHANANPNAPYPSIDYSSYESHVNENKKGTKPTLNTIIAGHVDSGKSTLLGHLAYLCEQIEKKEMRKHEKDSIEKNKASFKYAFVMDQREDERERGVTIDVGERSLPIKSKIINFIDAPGHKDFVPKMITGAVYADAAILLANADIGAFESGFGQIEYGKISGQTREHARLIKSLGVSSIVVAVNKMDCVGYDETRFEFIKGELEAFFKDERGKNINIVYVPVSAITGENLVAPFSDPKICSWYKGPTFLEVLENLKIPEHEVALPFRLSVFSIYDSHFGSLKGNCIRGKVESGYIDRAEKYSFKLFGTRHFPFKQTELMIEGKKVKAAVAGDMVDMSVQIHDNHQFSSIHNGSVLSSLTNTIPVASSFIAEITTFENAYLLLSSRVTAHINLRKQSGKIKRLIAVVDASTGNVIKRNPKNRTVVGHSIVVLQIELEDDMPLEVYKNHKAFGRVALRDSTGTVGVGIITELVLNAKKE